ncbi:MAG: right-handed parallel beta-helix repeat-containing protein, partial [Thermoplasmata archaeon]
MRMRIVSGITLTLFLISMLTLAFNIQPIGASETIYIGSDYTFTSNIYEKIVVTADNVVIDGNGYTLQRTGVGIGIDLTGRINVTIKNMEIRTCDYGIFLDVSSNNVISGNNITNNSFGIWFEDSSSNNNISGNDMKNNRYGIYSYDSFDNTIFENNITNNDYGIYLLNSPNNTFRGNNIANNKYNFIVRGKSISDFINDVNTSNTVDGKSAYYWISQRNRTVPLDAGYVALVNCTRIAVQNLTLANNGQGVLLVNTTNSTITKNNITANAYSGIRLSHSSNFNTISGNNIKKNFEGIYLSYSSSFNTISGNNIEDHVQVGIEVNDSNFNIISKNNITNNDSGIWVFDTSGNTISGNNIKTHNQDGIQVAGSSNNTISENSITDNRHGIYFYPSSNNTIYHNDFVDNSEHVYSDSSTNTWDNGYPSGGNYWSDYAGEDANWDGIGDTPYIIDENNQDNYPLMNPWAPSVEPRTWTVDDDKPADFSSIQEAVNNANSGDIIFVHSGTYYENVVANKTVSLIGENRNTTIIDGNNFGHAMIVTAINVNISGFTIRRSPMGSGIHVYRSSGNSIVHNIILNNYNGIWLYSSSNNSLNDNIVSSSGPIGIQLEDSDNNILFGNTVLLSKYGIMLESSGNNTIIGNVVSCRSVGLLLRHSNNNVIIGNNATYHDIGIWLFYSNNNTVTDNNPSS